MLLRDVLRQHHDAARANTPCGFSGVTRTVLFGATVPPPPSVGAHSPVDARSYRLRTHPFNDVADTPAHCWCFWHDCRTAPTAGAVGLGTSTRRTKFSQMLLAALSASRLPQPHHQRTHTWTGQRRLQRSVRTPVVLTHHLQPNNRKNYNNSRHH
ncbi:hypothetical protein C3747_119g76 [Trypanosoma cruzi]|uniref:Uncharacterized protein n=1 Tax=Trypanosoma cruzi TaxID=5693 RepID=A0A2V2WD31_TRYCR|nr:hypothetical protein C3747_119g76 [Trypanosoma cruzi]